MSGHQLGVIMLLFASILHVEDLVCSLPSFPWILYNLKSPPSKKPVKIPTDITNFPGDTGANQDIDFHWYLWEGQNLVIAEFIYSRDELTIQSAKEKIDDSLKWFVSRLHSSSFLMKLAWESVKNEREEWTCEGRRDCGNWT